MMRELGEDDLKELGLKMGERKAFLKKVLPGPPPLFLAHNNPHAP
jgi:hypothetical protein